MAALDLALIALGGVLIVAVYVDIFLTVLHPSIESPLSNWFQRLVWQLLRATASRAPRAKAGSALLSAGLPLMVAGLIVLWLVLLCLGFACLYYPWLADPAFFNAERPLRGDFLEAIYYSGVTLATLGYGDIQPLTVPFRLIAVAEALTGAVTISAAVAYILAVYPALARQRTIARVLNAEAAGHGDALPMLRRYMTGSSRWHDDLFTQLRALALDLLDITESHETHPVLYYAHARQAQHSFLRVLVTAQSLVAITRYSLSVEHHPEVVRHPHVLLLEQALHYSVRQLGASIHIAPAPPPYTLPSRDELLARFAQLCGELEQLGLTSARADDEAVPVLVESEAEAELDDQPVSRSLASEARDSSAQGAAHDPALDYTSRAPAEAFVVFHQQTDPLIAAYGDACGYSLADARANYRTTWWTGGVEAKG